MSSAGNKTGGRAQICQTSINQRRTAGMLRSWAGQDFTAGGLCNLIIYGKVWGKGFSSTDFWVIFVLLKRVRDIQVPGHTLGSLVP